MVNLTVTKDINGDSGAIHLPADDIFYMRHSSKLRRVVIYTQREVYYTTGPLSYWCSTLNNSGYEFFNVDRTVGINLRKVIRVNDVFKTAYFDMKNKDSCMLSKKGFDSLREHLKVLNIPLVTI